MNYIDYFEFTVFWNEYIKQQTRGSDIQQVWENTVEWNKIITNNLSDELNKKFKLGGVKNIRKEWRKFDLVVGTDDYFENLCNYDLSGFVSRDDHLSHYPRHQLLLFEHESDYKTCLNEFIKLTYERARTKILVTYPTRREHRISIINNAINILDQSHTSIEEMSEYFIVFGEKFDDVIYWTFYELGFNGSLMHVHQFSNKKNYPLNLDQLENSNFEKK